jgi:hypothetical protein
MSLYSPKISLNLLVFDCRWVLQLDSAGSVFYSTAPRWVRQSSGVDLPQYANGSKNYCDSHLVHYFFFSIHLRNSPGLVLIPCMQN